MRIKSEVLRAKVYPLLVEAIEAGVAYGWLRAHKHDDDPGVEAIKEAIEQSVIHELLERFEIEGE